MKVTSIISAIAVSLTMAMPVAAHHNCAAGDVCPTEIGDAMDMHEAALDSLDDMRATVDPMGENTQTAMDPADSTGGAGEWDEYFGAGPLGRGSLIDEED